TYLRDRIRVARELLADSGSLFVQIGDDNVHRCRLLLDELMGSGNSVAMISMQKSGSSSTTLLPEVLDYILWYAKDLDKFKGVFQPLYEQFDIRNLDTKNFRWVEDANGDRRTI